MRVLSSLRWAALAAACAAPLGAAAQQASASCALPAAGADPLTDRAGILAQYERLPQACLQALVTACTDASDAGMLDFGSAATCSFSYEALLRQHFGGDFGQLLAWWRQSRRGEAQRDRPRL